MTTQKQRAHTSASAIDTFLDCPRKWWFQKILKLPEAPKSYFTFGTVMHAVVERWMAATDNGRVPSPVPEVLAGQKAGAPVDVFPPGWETVEERDGSKATISPAEARQIRKLFSQAVERGIIARTEGIQVEREVRLELLPDLDLLGYVDLYLPSKDGAPPEIHDHKSFGKSSARYLKQPGPTDAGGQLIPIEEPYSKDDGTSPNSVGHNQQLLTYAAVTSMLDGWDGPVVVQHNQYPKFEDSKGVRKVRALVSPKRLMDHWESLKGVAQEMLLVQGIQKWTDTPPPKKIDACSSYGGCPFAGICGKRETPQVYSSRIKSQIAQQAGAKRPDLTLAPKRANKGKEPMGDLDIFARARAQKMQGGAGAAKPAATTKPAATVAKPAASVKAQPKAAPAAAPAAPAAQGDGAPWANPNCPACKGLGMNSKGRACPICDQTAKKAGRPTSAMFTIEIDGDGQVTAVVKDEHAETVSAAGAEEAWVGTLPGAAPAAAAPAAEPEAEPEPEVAQEEPQPEPEPPAAAPARTTLAAAAARAKRSPKPSVQAAVAAAVADPTPAEEPAAAPEPTTSKGRAGRPAVGMTLLIGATRLKGPERPTITAQAVLEQVGAEMAKDMGAESYWELDPFKRRDRVRQRAETIAELLNSQRLVIFAPGAGGDPDLNNLVNALVPFAELVVEGTR